MEDNAIVAWGKIAILIWGLINIALEYWPGMLGRAEHVLNEAYAAAAAARWQRAHPPPQRHTLPDPRLMELHSAIGDGAIGTRQHEK